MRRTRRLRALVTLGIVLVCLVLSLLSVRQTVGAGGSARAWCDPDRCPGGCITLCDETQYGCWVDGCRCGCWCGQLPGWSTPCPIQQ